MAHNGNSRPHPAIELEKTAKDAGLDVADVRFAELMDEKDPLRELRKEFHYPTMSKISADLSIVNPDEDCIYMCGNSLGLCPKNTRQYALEEIDKWENTALQGHRGGSMPWAWCEEMMEEEMTRIVGGKKDEVVLMNALTVNLHLMMISFYRPNKDRYKILLESKAFPSDHYAVESQIRQRGLDPADAMLCMEPREGETTLRTEDILAMIEKEGDKIALICFPGVQYYTGQFFDIPTITKAGQAKGCYVGWDLAHAVGNLPLYLHDWGVDYACWCTYKYLNSGAGSMAGVFLHERHRVNDFPKLLGWWGHKLSTRFVMDNKMDLIEGAGAYRISNASPFVCIPMKASFDVFKKTSMEELRKKSILMTGYLELLINKNFQRPAGQKRADDGKNVYVDIFTPSDPNQRGCQLSLAFNISVEKVFVELEKRGVICDKRLPSVIRIAPSPMYCSFKDVYRFIIALSNAIAAAAKSTE